MKIIVEREGGKGGGNVPPEGYSLEGKFRKKVLSTILFPLGTDKNGSSLPPARGKSPPAKRKTSRFGGGGERKDADQVFTVRGKRKTTVFSKKRGLLAPR